MKKTLFLCLIFCLAAAPGISRAQISELSSKPGLAMIKQLGNRVSFENNVLEMTFAFVDGKVMILNFTDKEKHESVSLIKKPLFSIQLADDQVISSDDFMLTAPPAVSAIKGNAGAIQYAERLNGEMYSADFENKKSGLKIHWVATLRNGANYVRQSFTLTTSGSIRISQISPIDLPATIGLQRVGTVDGSPLVHNNMFFTLEHPMSQISIDKDAYTIFLPRLMPVDKANPLTLSVAWGVCPENQMRRGFDYYIERERAVPYHQMLHYNSWFDISWTDRKLNEAICLDRIKTFKDSLIDKRRVRLKAFLFDDGWDDDKSLWQFNTGFPNGFTKLAAATNAVDAALGVWISPWGGYDLAKKRRMEYGKKQNPPFETNENGFSLTGPVYFKRFKAVTTSFIKNANVSMFKFDGVGAGDGANGASVAYQGDIEAYLKLISELRNEKPDLYLSLTVGTWPSVYWLKFGDVIWRAGDDTGLKGEGPKRQQWITYKDWQTYLNIVKRAPLFPLNSVMYHGICIADNGLPGQLEMDTKNVSDEIWSFFGNGTSLQELYVNPHKLSTTDWNCLRSACNWSRENAGALADIHWVGGDPSAAEVYGYAGWMNKKGVLTLRNPSAIEKTFVVHVKKDLDIPRGYSSLYAFFDAKEKTKSALYKGETFTVKLAPFEVKVMDAKPLD